MSTKYRLPIIILVALAGALLFFRWWRVRHHEPFAEKPASDQSAPQDVPTETSTATATSAPAPTPMPPPTPKPSSELRRTFEILNHNEIEFYGRAVDQFGEPVPAADVEGVVLVNTGTQGGQMRRQTMTDAHGSFQFGGFKGQDLGIAINKEGYEYRRHNSSFSYSYFEADHKRHIPDPENPVIFVLWKKQGAEPLVHYEKIWRFPVNTGPIRINLMNGELDDQRADLVVTIARTPLQMRYGERGFAWHATIEVPDGGLVQLGQRDYYNLAPETGYLPRFEITQESQSVRDAQAGIIQWTWMGSFSDIFFISSRNGQLYGRINLRIRPNSDRKEGDNEALIAAEVWLNSNGSRNLEFDPAKVIRPAP